jgi:5-methylcytosine-specific restriction protein A
MKLARAPLCEVADCHRPATVVDHRLDRRTHPELTYVIENLTSMCKSHHDSKTARTRSGWGRRGTV